MKIVIDIPEEMYKEYVSVELGRGNGKTITYNLLKAIKNGTPLPEHHGRLIDISEYEKYFNTAIIYDDGNHEHVVYTDTIPTIVEGSDSQ